MKKLFFSILSFLLVLNINAQVEPAKALKKAKTALGAYNPNPSANADKLSEAIDMINIASGDAALHGNVKLWLTKGEIYNAAAQNDVKILAIPGNEAHVSDYPDAGINASNAFHEAAKIAEKKYDKNDAYDGLLESGRHLNFLGNTKVQNKDYVGSYKFFKEVWRVHSTLSAAGKDSPLQESETGNHRFVTAYCASLAGETAAAKELFKELYEEEFDEPTVYAQYFNILNAEGDESALTVLEKGREKFPDNPEILFGEINYYIQKGNFAVLEVKLKEAIAKEPDNPSVYSALGNVYMNLFTEEYKANGDSEQSKTYFNSALEYFSKAKELDPNAFDAIYSIGSLYFNKAVEIINVMAGLPIDKVKEYDALKKESDDLLAKALPLFKRAESLNANDTNTLIALSEIFARTNEFELSTEFKSRLELVKNGTMNEKSYFSE